MADLKPGDPLDVLGPLGNTFSLPNQNESVFILSGGTGIGSVYLLYSSLKKNGHEKLTFATGFRDDTFYFSELDDSNVVTFTEDGSTGRKGLVTEMLQEVLDDPKNKRVYACGPHGMLQAVSKQMKDVPCETELSIEETMACGIGACLGCVVEALGGRKTVCKEGPVFNLRALQ